MPRSLHPFRMPTDPKNRILHLHREHHHIVSAENFGARLSGTDVGLPVCLATPRERYYELVAHGTLRADEHQKHIIGRLQSLHEQLVHYNPPTIPPIETGQSFVRLLVSSAHGSPNASPAPRR